MRPFIALLAFLALIFVPVASPAFASGAQNPGVGAPVLTAASADAGIGIRLVDIPAAAQDDPRAHSYIVDNLPPGTTVQRRIEVQNNTATAQSVHLYAGAAHITHGSFVGDDAAATNALTRWTSVAQPTLQLAAGGSAKVGVTIAVPADAAEGEQYGAVWAEVRSAPDPKSNIVSASRTGIRMYISVGPGNGPAADFSITHLTASRDTAGASRVTATVTNTGGRALDVSGKLSLAGGPSGLSAGPFSTTTATTLAPGGTGNVAVLLGPDLPNGPWDAQLFLQSGVVTHQLAARISFPKSGRTIPITSDSKGGSSAIVIGITAAATALAAVGLIIWRRRRQNQARL